MTDIDKIRRKQNATCGVCGRKWNDHRMRHKFLGDKPDVADIPVLLDYIDVLAVNLAESTLDNGRCMQALEEAFDENGYCYVCKCHHHYECVFPSDETEGEE